jgi:hypothetical protein
MSSSPRRLGWPGWVFYSLLAIIGSLIIWNWPQSPRWRMSVANPEHNRNKIQLLFFSSDSKRVFVTESDQDHRQASVVHYDANNGTFLERVELWRDRIFNTRIFPPVLLGRMPSHGNRTLVAIITQANGSKDVECYDAYQGQNPVAKLTGINQVSHSLSGSRRWAQYFAFDPKKQERPDLIIADTKSGEVVMQLKPECDPAGKAIMAYGWMAAFDPTERYVAVDWNTLEGMSPNDPPEKHQSQIRIYDLQTRQEVRRLLLPPGSSWSVRSWEGDQLWAMRTWLEHSNNALNGYPFISYSRENCLELTQDHPQPIEYPQFWDRGGGPYHTRGVNWLAFQDTGSGKKRELPQFLQKLTEWFHSLKEAINEYFPERGTKVWFADPETGQLLWECRLFSGSHAISPDGQLLAITFIKKDSIEIEMWDTHYPRRWWWVLGYLALLATWVRWRSTRSHAALTAVHS